MNALVFVGVPLYMLVTVLELAFTIVIWTFGANLSAIGYKEAVATAASRFCHAQVPCKIPCKSLAVKRGCAKGSQ